MRRGYRQFLTAWRLVLSMKPWSYMWLEFGLFSTIIAIIRACACWALFVVTLTNTVHLMIIYIYIYTHTRVIIQAQHEEDLMLKFTLFSVNCLQVQWPDYGVISYNFARKLIIHLLLDKMAAIFAKTFSNAFSWMKMTELRFKLYWNLFPGVQLTIRHHWFK